MNITNIDKKDKHEIIEYDNWIENTSINLINNKTTIKLLNVFKSLSQTYAKHFTR